MNLHVTYSAGIVLVFSSLARIALGASISLMHCKNILRPNKNHGAFTACIRLLRVDALTPPRTSYEIARDESAPSWRAQRVLCSHIKIQWIRFDGDDGNENHSRRFQAAVSTGSIFILHILLHFTYFSIVSPLFIHLGDSSLFLPAALLFALCVLFHVSTFTLCSSSVVYFRLSFQPK